VPWTVNGNLAEVHMNHAERGGCTNAPAALFPKLQTIFRVQSLGIGNWRYRGVGTA
jgi:hypothetical protein